jgi:hypothetical protein
MKPEKQRIAIAKSCGWTWTNKCPEHGKQTIKFWLNEHTGRKVYYEYLLPYYLDDLNDMADAEETLTESLQEIYLDNLYAVCNPDSMYNDTWKMNRATAAQRAEAFLRTVGRWEE